MSQDLTNALNALTDELRRHRRGSDPDWSSDDNSGFDDSHDNYALPINDNHEDQDIYAHDEHDDCHDYDHDGVCDEDYEHDDGDYGGGDDGYDCD